MRVIIVVIGSILFGLTSFATQAVFGQTRLGLHVTTEELNIWKQRTASGPYKNAGDVSVNSPGDWAHILTNANTADLSVDRFVGYTGSGCVPNDASLGGIHPKGEKLRDTAFVYMLTGTLSYRTKALNEMLAQAVESGVDFTNSSKWCVIATNNDNFFRTASWITKIMYAFDYLAAGDALHGQTLSGPNRATIENWFLGAATYFEQIYHATIGRRFIDRKAGNYTISGNWSSNCTNDFMPIYYGRTIKVVPGPSNRDLAMVMPYALVGVAQNNARLKAEAKRAFEEYFKFTVLSDNTPIGDMYRWTSNAPTLGIVYTFVVVGELIEIADVFARDGDTSLYDYTTGDGACGTAGGAKGLLGVLTELGKFVDHTYLRYGTDQTANNGNVAYLIDTDDGVSGGKTVGDHIFAMANLYYQSPYLKSIYTRTAPGQNGYTLPGYPSSPSNGGYYAWGSAWGKLPGVLFMFGQMEGKVSPYPDMTVSPPPPSSSSTNPIGYWKFDEGSGMTAKDSSGTGNNATLLNGVLWTTGKSGSAVSFDGLDDFVKIATTNFSNSQGTFSAWVKASFFKSGEQFIFGHTSIPAYGSRLQLYTDDSGGNLDMGIGSSHASALNIQQLQPNTWYHIALTWSSSNYVIYVNGVQKTTGSYSGFSTLNSYAHIGGAGYDSIPQSWTGAIDEVKIWNRSLTASELQIEYNFYQASPPTAPSNVVLQAVQ
jgi:hypothetical protein